jgi:tetratricopeptide (TPR) repeat protein
MSRSARQSNPVNFKTTRSALARLKAASQKCSASQLALVRAALAALALAAPAAVLATQQPPAATAEVKVNVDGVALARLASIDEQVQEAFNAKDWLRVIGLSSEAIALDPQVSSAWRRRGAARSELEQHDPAIADRRMAVELEPASALANNGLCWSLILAGRSQEARAWCERALAAEPQNLATTVNLGNTYLLQGDKPQAWRWYEQSIGLVAGEQDLQDGLLGDFDIFERKGWQLALVREARAHFEPRGRNYLEAEGRAQALLEQIWAAEQAEDRARELELRQQRLAILDAWLAPGHPRRLVIERAMVATQAQLGKQLLQAGKHKQAIPHYVAVLQAKEVLHGSKPVKEQSELIVPLNDLAIAYRHSGDYSTALPLFEKALVICELAYGSDHRNTGAILSNLASLYESMGQHVKALLLYQRALSIMQRATATDQRAGTLYELTLHI